ncbi:MAG: tetratricopeptide repeat protein [Polyangiaceae bacterium]|nr:tetratricopeptide repeat protein [Polyangiaceae bacterium]
MRTRSNNRSLLARLLPSAALALFLLSPSLVFGAEPTAQDREEAKRAYTEGRKLAKEGKLAEAVEAFRRAHDRAPTPVTRLELARALQSQGKLVEAHRLADSTPGMPITATETQKSKVSRTEARELATLLAAKLPKVVLVVKGAGAETKVAIDGLPVSQELLSQEQPIDPGSHVATATMGDRSVEVPFSLAESERKEIELDVSPPPPVEPPAPAVSLAPKTEPKPQPKPVQSKAPPEEEGLHPFVPVMFTVASVSLVTAVVTGSVALSQASELKDACPNNGCPPEWHSELSTHEALAVTSTVAFAVGGAAAAAGIVGWIVDATSSPSPTASVKARFTGTGLAVEGAW